MKALKTHFEQLPVEIVKKIAKELPEDAIENTPREPWREAAQKVQEEKDPVKMIALVETLIAKLDEKQMRKRLPRSQS